MESSGMPVLPHISAPKLLIAFQLKLEFEAYKLSNELNFESLSSDIGPIVHETALAHSREYELSGSVSAPSDRLCTCNLE
jgi:hypothetical protein